MAARFKLLAHPADIGIEATGATLPEASTTLPMSDSLIVEPSTVMVAYAGIVLEANDLEPPFLCSPKSSI